jgi:hypothetical protein
LAALRTALFGLGIRFHLGLRLAGPFSPENLRIELAGAFPLKAGFFAIGYRHDNTSDFTIRHL